MLKLGRIPLFDDRSRNFSIRKVTGEITAPVSRAWECSLYLNQGNTSSCVGHSWAHKLASSPEHVSGVTSKLAMDIYKRAQRLDEYPGTDYEGTSVLAGIKALRKKFPQSFDSYHWCFGLQELQLALSYVGPVVLGVNWYSSMFAPDSLGRINVAGAQVGGHAILATGVNMEKYQIELHNSWGISWGLLGRCYMSFADMARLLKEQGEACVMTGKKSFTIPETV